jgi:acetoacetyl-CoA synthetase
MIFALGALAIGAVVSTASTDFGPVALLDRFGQIEPKLLLAATTYQYSGRQFNLEEKLSDVLESLPSVTKVVTLGPSQHGVYFQDWLAPYLDLEFEFPQFPFSQPGFILFSSGTTGKPKCIIHSAAGVLLKVLSEQGYHLDINKDDRVFYATTCGWMMWNWLMIGLGREATIVLVDGSPAHPDLERFWKIASEERLTFLGVSAALIETWRANGIIPKQKFEIDQLRTIASTGSPLSPSGFDWVSEQVGDTVKVASIAGGTDLCGCLVLGVPTENAPRGEIQGPALGLDVKVFRSDGSAAHVLEEGELVCCTPFPSVPLGFWGDDDQSRITKAYFNRFENIWAHGDFARMTKTGGFEILGRLDATLNSKGVRIGTAEIYRVVMEFEGVSGALAVEQQIVGGTRIVLFVEQNSEITDEQVTAMKSALRAQASPRHVPELIVRAPALPRTRNGKLNELVVSDICMNRSERDSTTLMNPDSLQWFRSWHKQSS